MSHYPLMRAGVRALFTAGVLTSIFAAGAAAGLYFYPQVAADRHDHADDHPHGGEAEHVANGHAHEDEEDHIALTEQAFANLGLQMAPVTVGDYWQTLLVPARVVEIPGRSDLSVSAPVTGVIEDVQILPGQSLNSSTPLFVIRLTDETLIDAQSKLLETMTRQEVAQKEIDRLAPLIDSGVVAGSRNRELEYELKQLRAQESTLLQELRSRGLPQPMIDELLQNRELASILTVFPPSFIRPDDAASSQSSSGFSVEQLMVHPGKSVTRGQALCTVAFHSKLYLEGTAFEDDLPVLNRIAENDWEVLVETHGEPEPDAEPLGLQLLRIDNHVDEATQTVKFFVELPNEVAVVRQANDRLYEQWRFRPGQRLHVRLPVERWENQLMLPVDAVVVDGPNVFVFAEHHHDDDDHAHDDHEDQDHPHDDHDQAEGTHDHHDEHDLFIELEPIPVRLLYRDDRTVVIADDGQIPLDEPIALNHAYKLYLAMQMQAGGGGGHHDHDH